MFIFIAFMKIVVQISCILMDESFAKMTNYRPSISGDVDFYLRPFSATAQMNKVIVIHMMMLLWWNMLWLNSLWSKMLLWWNSLLMRMNWMNKLILIFIIPILMTFISCDSTDSTTKISFK